MAPCDRVARHEISNRGRRAYNGDDGRVVKEHLADIEPLGRASVEQRAAQALRELIVAGRLPEGTPLVQRELAERPRHLADADPARARRARADGTRRGGRQRARARAPADARGPRGAVRRPASGSRGSRPGSAPRPSATTTRSHARRARPPRPVSLASRTSTRTSSGAGSCTRSRTSRPDAPGSSREVERLFWRGERYHRLVLSSADRFARSVGSYRDFVEACHLRNGARAEKVIHESLLWGVDLIADSLPSELEG